MHFIAQNVSFGGRNKNLNKDRPVLLAAKMSSSDSQLWFDSVKLCVLLLQYADMSSSAISSSGAGGGGHLMCNYCNYTSPKRYLLARHLKAHSEERPHKCTICTRMFKTLPALQNHVNTHTGVRPQHCKVVRAGFKFKRFSM